MFSIGILLYWSSSRLVSRSSSIIRKYLLVGVGTSRRLVSRLVTFRSSRIRSKKWLIRLRTKNKSTQLKQTIITTMIIMLIRVNIKINLD